MLKVILHLFAFAVFFSISTAADAREKQLRILVMGDSLLASHSISGRAISDYIGQSLQQKVTDRSVMGARIIYRLPISGALGMNIGKQFRGGKWDWIVINGGGNDLWFGCGCHKCDRKIRRLISIDGKSGKVPSLIAKLRRSGAKIIYLGYLRSPGVNSPIESCKDEGDEFESRVRKMAAINEGVYFLSLAKLVPYGDRSYHTIDMVHPSLKASKTIGQLVATLISSNAQ